MTQWSWFSMVQWARTAAARRRVSSGAEAMEKRLAVVTLPVDLAAGLDHGDAGELLPGMHRGKPGDIVADPMAAHLDAAVIAVGGLEGIENRVHHLAQVHLALASAMLRRRDQRRNQRPFRVRQIARKSQPSSLGRIPVARLPHRAPIPLQLGCSTRNHNQFFRISFFLDRL
jgi:hypothetical protein